jgi:multiple sugar transport system permease protein/sn-glycerol 3-phosphate transport system permease protein
MADTVRERGGRLPRGSAAGRLGLHAVVILLCLLTVFPLFWMLSTAFKPPQEVFAPGIRLVPSRPTLENFPRAFDAQPVALWFLNSVVVATAIMIGKLLLSVPAAYAFARYRFRGGNVLFALVVGTMVVPGVITIIPNYVLVTELGWLNTPQGAIVPMIAFTGFYVFLLRQAMLAVPQEILDAARVDGANWWTILWRVVLPLVRPTVVVVAILSFLQAWNLYLWPLLVLGDAEAKTLTVGLQYFIGNEFGGEQLWGPLLATASLAIVPLLMLYAVAQKAIISAFVESGVKG